MPLGDNLSTLLRKLQRSDGSVSTSCLMALGAGARLSRSPSGTGFHLSLLVATKTCHVSERGVAVARTHVGDVVLLLQTGYRCKDLVTVRLAVSSSPCVYAEVAKQRRCAVAPPTLSSSWRGTGRTG
eukprot:751004-Hanusia_phi.AAC.7